MLADLRTETEQKPFGYTCPHLDRGDAQLMPAWQPGQFLCRACLLDDVQGAALTCFRCPHEDSVASEALSFIQAWPDLPFIAVVAPLCEECRHAEGLECLCPKDQEGDDD
ncbi:hypothetical protein AESSP_00380 [Aestuariimicrobium sp. T2.26MG-19.2B]|nr:hypothetical protein AESSP_00380 [Aestuariimicrobium sp. T2.26MG-19.2B]